MSIKRKLFAVLLIAALGTVASSASATAARGPIGRPESPAAMAQTTVTLDAIADATVRSWAPDTNFGDEGNLEISYEYVDEMTQFQAASLLRFDLSPLPDDVIIDTAELRLFLEGASGASPVSIAAYNITSSWNESTITWNTYLTAGTLGLSASIDDVSGSYKSWHITSYVQAWIADPPSNYGVLLRGPVDGTNYERWFESRNHLEMVPQLDVTYHRAPYTFTGHVYEGEPEDTSTPMEGVTVELWGDEDEWPEAGFERVRLATTTTSRSGAFGLEWQPDGEWPFLHVIEVDPAEAISTGAAVALPGYVKNLNVVSYRYDQILETGEHAFGGIAFWDRFPEELPDLIVQDLWPEGRGICIQIQNVGSGLAEGGHQAALYVDGTEEATLLVDTDLAPSDTWDGCFDYAWVCSGESDIVVGEVDATGVVPESDEVNNTRQETWACEQPPLQITSGPTVSGLTASSAVISWETNRAADSTVRYDRIARIYGFEETHSEATTSHELTLDGLTPSTTYHFVVRSTAEGEERVESQDRLFETLAEPDDQNPTVRILDPGVVSGTTTIAVDADDDRGVEKVEFYLDDELVFTDYSPPYEWTFDSGDSENGDHTLKTKAVDLSGRSTLDQLIIPVFNFIDTEAPQVNIFYPTQGANVYGDTRVWVTVSDDSGWSDVEWFVDGKKMGGGKYPVSPSLDIMFWWDTRFFSQGSHSLGVQATDGDNKVGSDVIVVNVANAGPASRPKLVVTKHEVFRHAHTFAIELTVTNQGQAAASGIEIVDAIRAFQPISRTFNGVNYETDLDMTPMRDDTRIKDPATLAAGASRKYILAAVPVLVHDKPPTPAVGSTIKLSYAGPLGTTYQETTKFEVLKTTATAGSAPSEPIATAHANAVKEADYLIVTNPSMLSFHNPFQDENQVLSDMARLAFDRDGVLGYLRTSNRNTLRNLIRTNGDWGKRLHSDFRTAAKGYLLIVGETEIVPAWRENRWTLTWSNSTCTTREADLSDLPYADTGGSDARPELIVGRIIGNDAVDLSRAIQTSLSGSFDRSHALLVSGTDGTASIQKLFTGSVDEIEKEIKSEFNVTKLHWKDISATQRVTQVRNNTSGKDVVLYQGHGGPDSWGDLATDDVLGDATTVPPTPGLSFGSANPVVFGWACLTGSYEDHVANSPCTHDGGDDNLAEAFFDRGAAVYIGATEVSPINDNRAAAKAMFEKWWKPNTTIGKALTDLKRDRWSSNGYTQLWTYEYNLYGDPKYGSAAAGSPSTQWATQEEVTSARPQAAVDVVVPTYEVTINSGFHEVEIPGGDVLLDLGDYRIPYYYTVLEYPPGYEIQDVTLTDRSGMVTDSGLNLPINQRLTTVADEEVATTSTAAATWVPEKVFEWNLTEDPDGTMTLSIVMYPFYYDPSTTNVQFYKNYSFDIDYTISPVTLTDMKTSADAYVQGETVTSEMWLQNSGLVQDISVSAEIKEYPTGVPVAGLQLETLEELKGFASFAPQWDTAGFTPGAYYVEATLRDDEHQVLDRTTQVFHLGVTSCTLRALNVTPQFFEVGDTISASLVFQNTGSVGLVGTAVIEVQGEGGSVVTEFEQHVSGLVPGGTSTFNASWETTGASDGSYTLLGYVRYDGGATPPAAASVSTGESHRIYLPLVLRSHP